MKQKTISLIASVLLAGILLLATFTSIGSAITPTTPHELRPYISSVTTKAMVASDGTNATYILVGPDGGILLNDSSAVAYSFEKNGTYAFLFDTDDSVTFNLTNESGDAMTAIEIIFTVTGDTLDPYIYTTGRPGMIAPPILPGESFTWNTIVNSLTFAPSAIKRTARIDSVLIRGLWRGLE